MKDQAEQYFNKAWRTKFHKPWDDVSGPAMDKESVPFFAARTLFREMICDVLSSNAGLQLKLSRGMGANSDLIMCRVRSPVGVLEAEADRTDYSLQFRDEVDPGHDFWFRGGRDEEIRNEACDLDRPDAEKRLKDLYEHQKITANDMGIFDNEPREHQSLWSRRVHTLERIADMVPCANDFPAYCPFATDPKRRHLFKQYQSVRGKMLFQSKDRLALTASIMKQTLTISTLMKQSVVVDMLALHDANQGEVLSNEVLTKRWVYPWKESRRKVGAPTMSSSYMAPDKEVPLLLYPFSQPLGDIRAYFGEKVTFYYLWLGFFTYALLFPALLGSALQGYMWGYGFTWCERGEYDYFQMAAVGAVVVWCVVAACMWKGERAIAATKWGTDSSAEETPKLRAAFTAQTIGAHGAEEWYVFGAKNPFGFMEGLYYELMAAAGSEAPNTMEDYQRNPVTNRYEPFYPGWLRGFWSMVSLFIIAICVGAVAAEVEGLMYLESVLTESIGTYGSYTVAVIIALLIPAISGLFNRLAEALTDNENHATQPSHDAALVVKVFALNVANYFGALLYIAFAKKWTYGCAKDCCMYDASVQFVAILVVLTLLKIMGPVVEMLKLRQRCGKLSGGASRLFFKVVICVVNVFATLARGYFGYMPKDYFSTASLLADAGDAAGEGGAQPWEQEFSREAYEGVFNDMAEATLLLMLVASFFAVFPAAPIFLVLMNLLEIRMDALKMMTRVRRPAPEAATGIGLWEDIVDLIAVSAALTNCALVVFTTNTFADYSLVTRFLIWFTATSAFIVLRYVLVYAIPTEPFGLSDVRKRHKFLRAKHVFGFVEDEDDDEDDSVRVRGMVDLESMDLSKMVGGEQNAELVDQIRNYQTQLRLVNNELDDQKAALQDAMLYEIMNNKTGIGETLDGLPLGCLYITLEKIENFMPEPLPFAGNIQMVISLRPNDSEKAAPGPPPLTSKRGRPTRVKGEIEFEELFTLAPVKTHKADIFFDIMDSSTDPKRRGTAFLSLAKLSDQLVHQKAIYISQRDPDNATRFNPSEAKLKVKVQFKYSKIKPIKERIAKLTKSQATIEKAITMSRLGRQRSDVA